jgi:predicted nucleic acid-binding protein
MILVSDSSPLIALSRIGRLELLRAVFGSVLLPTAVWDELVRAGMDRPGAAAVLTADWIEHRDILDVGLASLLRRDLGAGESEAIVLAREVRDALLLMDERMGRAAARRLGLRVTGLVGVLIEARERGLLPDAATVVDGLHHEAGFWLSEELRRLVVGPQ